MGFSARAHLSAVASTHYGERTYPKVDSFDEVSLRPDFTILVYRHTSPVKISPSLPN